MKKSELIDRVAETTGLTPYAVREVFDAVAAVALSELEDHNEVTLSPLGKLTVVRRAPRTVRNPATGETIAKPETFAPKFRASAELKRAVAS